MEDLKRGDIVFVTNESPAQEGVQSGSRPHLIISNDTFNKFAPVVTCVPLTSRCKRSPVHYFLHRNLGLSQNSYALCEQITTVPKSSISSVLCKLPQQHLSELNRMLAFQLAL